MLNSKYAPIVALAVVGILIIAALGWFLAISPQFAAASDLNDDKTAVEDNTSLIEASSDKLDEYQAEADALPSNAQAIELNTPTTFDLQGFRARWSKAVTESKVEVVSTGQDVAIELEGWTAEPSQLVSNIVATLFATGPITVAAKADSAADPAADAAANADSATAKATGWAPIVEPSTESLPVAQGLVMIPLTLEVTGTPAEVNKFFGLIANPDDPIYQVYNVTLEARQSDAPTINGVADAKDGDVIATVTGAMYLLNADTTVVDETELVPVTPGKTSSFIEPDDAPDQPGA
jgi:hypothetical protein